MPSIDKVKAGQKVIVNGRTVEVVKVGKSQDLRRLTYLRDDGKQDVALFLSHEFIHFAEAEES